MRSSRSHTAYLVECAIALLVWRAATNGRRAYLWTFTFREPVTDFEEAKSRARPLVDLIRRRGGRAVGVWEIQRGRQERHGVAVWHLHAVVDVFLDVNWLREWMKARGWGPYCRVDALFGGNSLENQGEDWVRGQARRVARYVSKYMVKDAAGVESCEAGKRPVAMFVGKTKPGTVRFTWAGGVARLYRLGLGLYLQVEGLLWWQYLERLRLARRRGLSDQFRLSILRLGLEEVFGDERYRGTAVGLGLAPPNVSACPA